LSVITVREFAKLTTVAGASTLDRATISPADFAWLADGRQRDDAPRLVRVDGRNSLTVMNYVGVIRTPSGSEIEILPKHIADTDGVPGARRVLLQMISRSLGINPRVADEASLKVLRRPFTDWIGQMFLRETALLISKGLRQEYQSIEGRERYLRGRLDVAKQLRAGPTAASSFNIQHDVFIIDRPENRLIKTAVDFIARWTTVPSTLQLATELKHLLREVPVSRSVTSDFTLWRSDRLMIHYQPTKELCRLILTGQTPFSVSGESLAQSMLFPMERLFEDFVARSVRSALPAHFEIRRQPRTYKLCSYQQKEWFDLRPDLLVTGEGQIWIIDAKWKLLNSDPQDRFGLSQADLYQLNAYGQTYLGGKGDLWLVYPLTSHSPKLNEPMHLRPDLRIHVTLIDLATGRLDLPVIDSVPAP
jgi:5-methylcytosine-specific restriction enzyme subunit McrC